MNVSADRTAFIIDRRRAKRAGFYLYKPYVRGTRHLVCVEVRGRDSEGEFIDRIVLVAANRVEQWCEQQRANADCPLRFTILTPKRTIAICREGY